MDGLHRDKPASKFFDFINLHDVVVIHKYTIEEYTQTSLIFCLSLVLFSFFISRLKLMLKECEPKIHFALVCGAKSCPPIKTYSAQVYAVTFILSPMFRFGTFFIPVYKYLLSWSCLLHVGFEI